MSRFIGIRHRIKRTKAGEASPTQVVILDGEQTISYELDDETAELDWLMDRFPIKRRAAREGEDLSLFLFQEHHINWKKGEEGKVAHDVPAFYDGFRKDDVVGMLLGGSGGKFSFALSRRGEEIGACVKRIPSFVLSGNRQFDMEEDARNLAHTVRDNPNLFYDTHIADRKVILLAEHLTKRIDAMKARIACEQRLKGQVVGDIFCNEEGHYPEGSIDKIFDATKANDVILQNLVKEENARERELERSLFALDIWPAFLENVEGLGFKIACRIIGKVLEIQRFATIAKFKAYCGVHLLSDGSFPRKKSGEVANWQDLVRQAFYLFAEQCNRRPESEWGQKLRLYKLRFRERHPTAMCKSCNVPWTECPSKNEHKRAYNNGHIQKMALWRTSTKFAEWLYRTWMKFEKERRQKVA